MTIKFKTMAIGRIGTSKKKIVFALFGVPLAVGLGVMLLFVSVDLRVRSTPILYPIVAIDERLVHLGDQNFQGAINSQLRGIAVGTKYSQQFPVYENQLKLSRVTLKITVKGAERQNALFINDKSIGAVCCSPRDGSYGELQWSIDPGVLKVGTNVITITSTRAERDFDDFEFSRIVIEFA